MREKIKILTVIRHPVGGIRTYLKYTYGRLSAEKYAFTVVTVKNEEAEVITKDLAHLDLKVIEVDGKYSLPALMSKVFSLLYKEKFDLIHSQGFTAGALAVMANLLPGLRHMITSHDVFREDQFSSRSGFLKKRGLEILLDRADMIQSVSHDAQENLLAYFPSLSRKKDQLTVVLNGISTRDFSENTEGSRLHLRKELGLKDEAVLFGFLGRFMPQKGFIELIDAVEALSKDPEVSGRFKIVAVNDGAFIREYKAIIREKGLSDYFIFYGFTPDVAKIMQELTAVVIPSLWEACPILPMEAFVLGCPVIASDCIGLREVISGTPAAVVKTKDVYSLADTLKQTILDPAPAKKRALEYVEKAIERFDVKYTAEKLDKLIDQLVLRG